MIICLLKKQEGICVICPCTQRNDADGKTNIESWSLVNSDVARYGRFGASPGP